MLVVIAGVAGIRYSCLHDLCIVECLIGPGRGPPWAHSPAVVGGGVPKIGAGGPF